MTDTEPLILTILTLTVIAPILWRILRKHPILRMFLEIDVLLTIIFCLGIYIYYQVLHPN
jgi:hypothetical protein